MKVADGITILCAAVVLAVGGIAGGMNRWGGGADNLPFYIWSTTLPALAVWNGRRLKKPLLAIGLSGSLGAVFILPSLFLYHSDENWIAALISIVIPVIVSAIAFATRDPEPVETESQDRLQEMARNVKTRAIVGILFFGQLLQPAVFVTACILRDRGEAIGDEKIWRPAVTAKIIAAVILSLIALLTLISVLLAFA